MKKLICKFFLKESTKELYTKIVTILLLNVRRRHLTCIMRITKRWLPRSFDKCLKEFYGDSLNVVCGIEHQWNGRKVGVFEVIKTNAESNDGKLRNCRKSIKDNVDYTIPAIKEGILQGLSTEGWFDYMDG